MGTRKQTHDHVPAPKGNVKVGSATYQMTGRFFEACDCSVPCPCWFDASPSEGECTGVVAWQIENGQIRGVDVTGLAVVSASFHGGLRSGQRQMRVALLIDAVASPEQHAEMEAAFTGRLGGPLGELAKMAGSMDAVESATITFIADGDGARVEVPQRVGVVSRVLRGATKRPITVSDGALSSLLGTPGTFGKSSRFRLTIERVGIDLDVKDRSTTIGQFTYSHRE
jgi:hypothetical protein